MSRTGNSYRDRNYNSGFFGSEGRGSGSNRIKGTQVVFEIMKQSTQNLTVVMGHGLVNLLKPTELYMIGFVNYISMKMLSKKKKEGEGVRGEEGER